MKKIYFYPGRFQPMGPHHAEVFSKIMSDYDSESIGPFIVTSDKVALPKSPLNFEEKKQVMIAHGIPGDRIIQVSNPYYAKEILFDYEPSEVEAIYLVGAKDMAEDPRFKKTEGTTKEGYKWSIEVAPHVTKDVGGKEMSGTSLRATLAKADKETFYSIMGFKNETIYNLLTQKFSQIEEDFYDPRNKYYDFAKSNVPGPKDDIPLNKHLRTPRQSKPLTYETRGGEAEMHIYDFDETIARAETPIPYEIKSPEGEVIESGETTSVEFENKREELENEYDEGVVIDYNFDAFRKLIGDATINNPIFQKLLDSIKNPNAKVTILTARSVGYPVTRFLKDQGIWAYVKALGEDIDGAVTGQDKANWIDKRIKDTTKKVIFIDDSDDNKEAVSMLSQKYPDIEFDIQDPPPIDEMMMGMMTEPEKKKHAKNLKRLKKYTDKQGNKYAPVPDFIKGTLKRKLSEVQAGTGEIYVYENKYYIDDSDIQGIGAFADNNYPAGTIMGKLHDMPNGVGNGGRDYNFYELGRSYNHSDTPNCENLLHNNTRYLVTIQPIQKGEELTADYTLQPELEQPYHFLNETNVFTKRWWKKIINEALIVEGGAAGHMNHPFDDRELTFGQVKELISLSLQGNLDIEEEVTEKTDGQNIAVTYKDGKVGAARNKATIREPMDINAVAAKFEGRGDIKDAFVNSMADLENALKELDEDTLNNVFQNGTRFLNMEIIYPETKNVITYGPQAYLQFHGLDEFNLESATKIESYGVPDSLKDLTQNVNARTQDTFEIIPPKIVKTQEVPDFSEKESYYLDQINQLQQEFNLSDDDPVLTYHEKWWEQNIDELFPDVTEEEKNALVRRWASFKKDFPLRKITDKETSAKVIEFDKNDFKQTNKQNVYQFEKIFLELGADVLANIDGFLAANPDESVQKLRKDVQDVQKQIEDSGDLDVLKKLEYQLKRIEDIGGFEKLVPSEGIVFIYQGKTYKLTGLFAPINQLLGLTKYV